MKNNFLRNLQIGFGFSLLLLIISSIASYISINNLLKSSSLVAHTQLIIAKLELVISGLKDAESGQRGFLLTGDETFYAPFNSGKTQALNVFDEVKQLTADNPAQQKNCIILKKALNKRLESLIDRIEEKRVDLTITKSKLEIGKNYMDNCRQIVAKMQAEEQVLLNSRVSRMNTFASYVPFLILIVSFLACLISILFYYRVRKDYTERDGLQKLLIEKEEEINNRISVIQEIAAKIAKGNYDSRIVDEEGDKLGELAYSLNDMAKSLTDSFTLLNDKEWLQTGLALLNEKLVGNKNVNEICYDTLKQLVKYGECINGALYLVENGTLNIKSHFAHENYMLPSYKIGEGIIGQVFLDKKEQVLNNVDDLKYSLSLSNGKILVTHILVLPILHEDKAIGAIEVGCREDFSEIDLQLFKASSNSIGNAIAAALSREQIQKFLEETQSQAEELQSQQGELENLNAELEMQAQKLQTSEEELKVQQEELLQTNQELEERSKLLEEKNILITDRNLEIQKKAEELALSTKYKSEFLANMSHELRTPLNSILLLSRMMSENETHNLNEDQVESAKVINSSGHGLLNLIDEILDLSKIEAGKMSLDYETVSIDDILLEMKLLFTPVAKDKNLKLIIEKEENVPQAIEIDKMRLGQILKNLLSNALKFTIKGEVKLLLKINPANKNLLEFIVSDTGIGISAEKQKLIFEAFQQADGSTKRKFGGTGLGLSISRELTNLLGGQLSVSSETSKGSVFTLSLPVIEPVSISKDITAKNPIAVSRDYQIKEEETAAPSQVVNFIPNEVPDDRNEINEQDKIILIIEDDTIFATVLLKYAQKQNYKGIIAVRGDQGIEMALKYHPVAILLDIQLPVKDGWQVMDELKANQKTRHIPVHIMSSLEVKKESLLKGAVDFVNKPLALEHLGEIFRKLEDALNRFPKKVLIVEENSKHAEALSHYLEGFNVSSEIENTVNESVSTLLKKDVDCVILDMGVPDKAGYDVLEAIKKNQGLENLPIIIFTGKSLSKSEEMRIKKYADTIVVKTAHSYQRILDEVGLFLHLVEDKKEENYMVKPRKFNPMNEVLTNKKVLIADDDVRNIYSLTKALEKHRMKVVSAIDGKEALEQLKANPDIEIVLMDMMMPELDGYETTAIIRKDSLFKNLPVIAITAKAMMGDREKCIQAGASDYISKPVDIDQLVSLLRVWLYEKK